MLFLVLALSLGVAADAGKLLFEVQQQKPNGESQLCPDQKSKCPNTATCCQLASGDWGCCPFAKASCCSDNVHCCPNGYTCNIAKQTCMMAANNATIPMAKKESAAPVISAIDTRENIVCPGGGTCSGTASCCRTYSGGYNCCGYPNDVCCSDGQHCCPRGTICDILKFQCLPGFSSTEWTPLTKSVPSVPASLELTTTPAMEKVPALKITDAVDMLDSSMVIYCDKTHYCSSGQTCCWLPTLQWGCCPYPAATCCVGSVYCCAYGKRCSNPPGLCF